MLIDEVLSRENMLLAHKRVVSNKGSPGVDGVTVDELMSYCQKHWARIREEILEGKYRPKPVLKKEIPKPGGGVRMLGIPCAIDRLIQQAVHQALTPIFDPKFSESSFGFRPGRSAHNALNSAVEHIESGHRWVVNIDLEKFFDRVNHDILMARIARRVDDKTVLRLIRRYLQAGMMDQGIVHLREQGTPQGGPLSPLASNILLDEVDKEMERRGHRFSRYADDLNVYVKSERAGYRVLSSLTIFLEKRLKLKVNDSKSGVIRPWRHVFLGHTFSSHKRPRLRIPPKSVKRFRDKVREIVQQGRGRRIEGTVKRLRSLIQGWSVYFRGAEGREKRRLLDGWVMHRLRLIIWHQWKTPRTRFKKLILLGVNRNKAARAAWGRNGAWVSSASSAMNVAFPTAYFKAMGHLTLIEAHTATK